MKDRIRLRNMAFYGYHGVYPSEQALGQRFEVDVELALDLRPVGLADDLSHGINYVDVYRDVKELVEGQPFQLLEALAEAIAERLLRTYVCELVVVRVRKPHVVLGGLLDTVEIEITRNRSEGQ